MKILIATPIFPPESGGPATYVQELSARLPEHYEVTLLTYAENPTPLSRGTLHVINKNAPLPLRLWHFYRKLHELAADVDVIYAQGAVAAGLPAALAARRRRKPLIIKMVGDEAWERARASGQTTLSLPDFNVNRAPGVYPKILRSIQFFVLRKADIVTTPSRYLAELFKRAYALNNQPVLVNYNPTTLIDVSGTQRTPHSIAVVNRLTRWKHVDEIIKAVALLKKRFPDVTLTIAGDGPLREQLETLAEKRNLTDSVTFLGDVPKTEVEKLLTTSSVYVLNSSYEGLPFTVLEAFAAKILVVATNIQGIK